MYAASWATYYEAAVELKRRRSHHVDRLPGALLKSRLVHCECGARRARGTGSLR